MMQKKKTKETQEENHSGDKDQSQSVLHAYYSQQLHGQSCEEDVHDSVLLLLLWGLHQSHPLLLIVVHHPHRHGSWAGFAERKETHPDRDVQRWPHAHRLAQGAERVRGPHRRLAGERMIKRASGPRNRREAEKRNDGGVRRAMRAS